MKTFYQCVIIPVFFLLFVSTSFAQSVYHEIFSLDYTKAKNSCQNINNEAEKAYFEAFNDFVFYLATGDSAVALSFTHNYHTRIKACKSSDNYERKVYQSEINFMLAVTYFLQNNYLKSALPAYKAYHKNKQLQKNYPDRKQHKNLSGLFEVAATTVPAEYNWITQIIGIQGSIEKGMKMLSAYQDFEENQYNSSLMSTILQSLVLSSLLNNHKKASSLFNKQDLSNQIALFFKVRYALKAGKNNECIKILHNYFETHTDVHLTFLYYQYGSALLHKMDTTADQYLLKYLEESQFTHFKRTTCLKLAWYYRIFDDHKKLQQCQESFYKYPVGVSETDRQATTEIQKVTSYHYSILKARILFDGGYYKQSLAELKKINSSELTSVPQKVELLYRYARIFHQLGHTDQAIKYYKSVVSVGQEMPLYFAAYSALQLGIIYHKLDDKPNARYFYKYCLNINSNQYKNAIEYKAKAGLSSLLE